MAKKLSSISIMALCLPAVLTAKLSPHSQSSICHVIPPAWYMKMCMNQTVNVQAVAAALSSHMLLALEVAVEYWLALSWSPQAQWLSGSGSSSELKDEVCIPSLPTHSYLF